jgi:queuine/archaeosine tRNA-ribosyltransferase
MQGMRAAIRAGQFDDFRRATVEQWRKGDLAPHA